MILGVITAPLLHTFITSAQTASKSRALGNATLCARSVCETIESTGMDALVTNLNGTGNGKDLFKANHVDTNPVVLGADSYTFDLIGLKSAESTFDARVTLEGSPFSTVNNLAVTQYTPMDAVYSQPSGVYENPDWLAASSFSNQASALSGIAYTAQNFTSTHNMAMNRTILITARKDNGRNEFVCSAKYSYSYLFHYTRTTVGADGQSYTNSYTTTLSDSYSYEFYRQSAATANFSSVYFFYYPNYMPSSGDYSDNTAISVMNQDDLTFSIFLIKQKSLILGSNGTVTTMADSDEALYGNYYTEIIRQVESIDSISPHARAYSNLTPNHYVYKIYKGGVWYRNGVLSGDLVVTKAQNRFYGLTVKLFSSGAVLNTDTPLYVMTASKLD